MGLVCTAYRALTGHRGSQPLSATDTLVAVLERDTLGIREVRLFNAVVRWSEAECQRQQLQVTPENKRKALGKALGLIRFPLMTIEEFAAGTGLHGCPAPLQPMSVGLRLEDAARALGLPVTGSWPVSRSGRARGGGRAASPARTHTRTSGGLRPRRPSRCPAGPAQSGILVDREVVSLFLHFTVNPKPRVEFIDRPRCCLRGKECSINRFQQVESRWGYSGTSDRIRWGVFPVGGAEAAGWACPRGRSGGRRVGVSQVGGTETEWACSRWAGWRAVEWACP